jgi:hypothetical protein
MAQYFETSLFGQHQIKKHKVRSTCIEFGHGFLAICGFDDEKAVLCEVLGEYLAHHWFIVHHEHGLDTGHLAKLLDLAIG